MVKTVILLLDSVTGGGGGVRGGGGGKSMGGCYVILNLFCNRKVQRGLRKCANINNKPQDQEGWRLQLTRNS